MVIAPATANTLSKMAIGRCDNLLLATYLTADCPVFFAPAMDLDMYQHPSTSQNIDTLIRFGNIEISATSGELASGLSGMGRMSEPETICETVARYFDQSTLLEGKKILVNAGPTYEKIDPVRFIGNYSSGKMGVAIANTLSRLGASVELVLGPTTSLNLSPNITLTHVESAEQMYDACSRIFPSCDAAILAAAVADFKPAQYTDQKIKKGTADEMQLILTRTKDILATLGKLKKPNQILAGFALETTDELKHAKQKLNTKNLDFIVLNSMNDPEAGFGKDTNKVTILEKNGEIHQYSAKSKLEVSQDITQLLLRYL